MCATGNHFIRGRIFLIVLFRRRWKVWLSNVWHTQTLTHMMINDHSQWWDDLNCSKLIICHHGSGLQLKVTAITTTIWNHIRKHNAVRADYDDDRHRLKRCLNVFMSCRTCGIGCCASQLWPLWIRFSNRPVQNAFVMCIVHANHRCSQTSEYGKRTQPGVESVPRSPEPETKEHSQQTHAFVM